MASRNPRTQDQFEARLRGLLEPQARAAPMPAHVVEIPDSWSRERPSVSVAAVAKVVGVSVAAVLAVILVAQFPRIAEPGASQVRAGEAAALLDISAAQVVETLDGAVAFRRGSSDVPSVEVLLVKPGDSGITAQLLVEVEIPRAVPPRVLAPPASGYAWGEPISCSAELGLRQPNMVVGGSNATNLAMASAGIAYHQDLFVAVLDAGAPQDDVLVEFNDFPGAPEIQGSESFEASRFDGRDACTGELRAAPMRPEIPDGDR